MMIIYISFRQMALIWKILFIYMFVGFFWSTSLLVGTDYFVTILEMNKMFFDHGIIQMPSAKYM